MKKIILVIMLVLLAATLIPRQAIAEDEFLIGLIPEENIFTQIKKHKPLANYISKELGVNVRFTILSRYPDIIDRFVSRKMDGAFFGIFTGVLAREKLGVVPVARLVRLDGSSTANAYVFVRKDSGIRSAADMRGTRAVFVDKATATGYLYLLAYLRENGIKNYRTHFENYTFIGSHDSAIYSVLSGRADVGVAKGRLLEKLSKKDPLIKDELLILSKSPDLPDVTLCVRADISPEFKSKLQNALLLMHNNAEGKKVLKQLDALYFVPAEEHDFDVVLELARKAGISNLKKFDYR